MVKSKHSVRALQSRVDCAGIALQVLSFSVKDSVAYCEVLCPVHGYSTLGSKALDNPNISGCKKCNMTSKRSLLSGGEDLVRQAISENYKDSYSFRSLSLTENKINLNCESHGDFSVSPEEIVKSKKFLCVACFSSRIVKSNRRLSDETWLSRARQMHGNRYEYHGVSHIAGLAWFDIECKTHGRFSIRAKSHAELGQGCRSCWYEGAGRELVVKPEEHFTELARQTRIVVSGEAEVIGVEGRSETRKIRLSCKAHGLFTSRLADLKKGVGCAKCACGSFGSSLTGRVTSILDSLGVCYTLEVPLAGDRQRWDIVIESAKLAIELDGLYWHSENVKVDRLFMVNKALCAESAGYSQINLFEDEILNKPEIIKAMLANRLGLSSSKTYARSLKVSELSAAEARVFLDATHIQGFSSGSDYLGLKNTEGTLLCCLVVSQRRAGRAGKKSTNEAVIERYATASSVPGGFSKLLKAFTSKNPAVHRLTTYSDPRLFTGELYRTCGFVVSDSVKTDYCYIKSGQRISKRARQKSWFKANAEFAEGLTEFELARLNGHFRLWDRGRITWVLELGKS